MTSRRPEPGQRRRLTRTPTAQNASAMKLDGSGTAEASPEIEPADQSSITTVARRICRGTITGQMQDKIGSAVAGECDADQAGRDAKRKGFHQIF